MLDIKILRDSPELIDNSLKRRHMDVARVDLPGLAQLDKEWRDAELRCDELRSRRNQLSTEIQKLQGNERQQAIAAVKAAKDELATLEARANELKEKRDQRLKLLPNLLEPDVPVGKTDDDNVEVSRWGDPKPLSFTAKNHVELGQLTDTIDFERAAKTVGASFYYLKHEAALLEMALCRYATEFLHQRGYIPISTPDLCRDSVLEGIGFAPRGPETQIYSIAETDLSLIATAEITVGGYHADEILDGTQLPLRYLGLSHCFRTEAGAHGKESRGLYRVHQFTKAEMFILCRPEDSAKHHEEIRTIEEELLRGLEIPYRVVNVCSGELGAPAAKKYDLEAWMPGRSAYGEVTSCSNCTSYQSRRLNIRFRPDSKAAPQFVHMLNGTAIAVSRTLIALYENYQQSDGSIAIPRVLRPYLPGVEKVPVRRA